MAVDAGQAHVRRRIEIAPLFLLNHVIGQLHLTLEATLGTLKVSRDNLQVRRGAGS